MASMNGSRVLVIGGAGFIGSHIIDRLLREDVREVAAEGCDHAVHLAALWMLLCHEYPRALESDVTDESFNVGRGWSTSIKALCELLLELAGSTLPIHYEPAGQTFVTRRVGSTEEAERRLDFTSEVEPADGLQRLIRWRRSDKALAA